MSKSTGGPVFPTTPENATRMNGTGGTGMTLRDWYAGQALAGLLAAGPHDCAAWELTVDASTYADEMIKRKKELEA